MQKLLSHPQIMGKLVSPFSRDNFFPAIQIAWKKLSFFKNKIKINK